MKIKLERDIYDDPNHCCASMKHKCDYLRWSDGFCGVFSCKLKWDEDKVKFHKNEECKVEYGRFKKWYLSLNM